MIRPTALALALLAASLVPSSSTAQEARVTVFAAASLAGALDDVVAIFEDRFGVVVTVSYAGTSSLARQIELGAPADIFVSADGAWMDHIEELGLIDKDRRIDLLSNQLVLIAPNDTTPDATTGIADLLRRTLAPGRPLAMADVEAVPAGRYGRAALQSLGIWEVTSPLVVQTDNVRTALAFVARGEAPLGIVYATDAALSSDVVIVATFDAELHPPIVYPAALLAGLDNEDAAALLVFLTGAEAAEIFRGYGFMTLAGD